MADYPEIVAPAVVSYEGADWGTDPDSGSRVIRLTSATAWSHNIYCEQPYGSPDGKRFPIVRAYDMVTGPRQLFVADVETMMLTLVETDLPYESVGHVQYGEWVYYPMRDGSVRRVSLLTLRRQQVCPAGSIRSYPAVYVDTISCDEEWLIGYERVADGTLQSFAFHLKTRERRVLREGPDNRNPHSQGDPGNPHRWLFQLIWKGPPSRVPVFVQDWMGGEPVQLPIGGDWSAESSGHMAWIARTGKVACAVNWDRERRAQDPRNPAGNLVVAGPGDAKPRVFPAPAHGFYHVSVSQCGRYFVSDDFMDFRTDGFRERGLGPTRIVIGNLETGKSRVLLRDCQSYGIAGTSRYEPDPYFTADTRHVIYNASPFGITQVFAAAVPPEFLRSLDA